YVGRSQVPPELLVLFIELGQSSLQYGGRVAVTTLCIEGVALGQGELGAALWKVADLAGRFQAFARLRESCLGLGVSKLGQQLDAQVRGRTFGERPVEQSNGTLRRRSRSEGFRRRFAERRDRRGIMLRGGLEQVHRDLRSRRMVLGEYGGGALVAQAPCERREGFGNRRALQGVFEGQRDPGLQQIDGGESIRRSDHPLEIQLVEAGHLSD